MEDRGAHSRSSVARAYRPARHSALCALDRRTARKGAQCCECAKVKELGEPKSCFSLSFVVPFGSEIREAHRSARHIDAERTAAVMNAPKEVKRRAGKRACSPVKEL